MANHLIGEVDLSEAGDGVVLRCLPGDLVALETKLSDKVRTDDGLITVSDIVRSIVALRASVIIDCVTTFAKRNGAPVKVNVDALGVSMKDLSVRVLDAISHSVHGKSYEQLIAELNEPVAPGAAATSPGVGSEI